MTVPANQPMQKTQSFDRWIVNGVPRQPDASLYTDWTAHDAAERLRPCDGDRDVDHAVETISRMPSRQVSAAEASALLEDFRAACAGLPFYWLLVTATRFTAWAIDRATLRFDPRPDGGPPVADRRWRPEPGELALATRLAGKADLERMLREGFAIVDASTGRMIPPPPTHVRSAGAAATTIIAGLRRDVNEDRR